MAYTEQESSMNFLAKFRGKFRPDMDIHNKLRAEAEDTKLTAESVQEKRKALEVRFPQREFPIAGFLERERRP